MKVKLKNLQSIGGRHWVRKNMDRVYLPMHAAWEDALLRGSCPISREIRLVIEKKLTSVESKIVYENLSSWRFWYDLQRKTYFLKISIKFSHSEEIAMLFEALSINIVISKLKTGKHLAR